MSELFSWPTVTVGMSPPCVNDDPPAPGCGAAAGRFRLLLATGITIALPVARRTRTTPGRVPWSAAGRPSTGQPSCSRRCAAADLDMGWLAGHTSMDNPAHVAQDRELEPRPEPGAVGPAVRATFASPGMSARTGYS